MAKTDFKTVDEYIVTRPPEVQAILQRVRRVIHKAVPGFEEAISYQIPTFKRHGACVVYLAGWTKHYSLYPVSARLAATLGDDLSAYEQSKGTIRFPLSESVPTRLISRIVKALAKEAEERARTRKAGKAKPRKR